MYLSQGTNEFKFSSITAKTPGLNDSQSTDDSPHVIHHMNGWTILLKESTLLRSIQRSGTMATTQVYHDRQMRLSGFTFMNIVNQKSI